MPSISGKKRALEVGSDVPKAKKSKLDNASQKTKAGKPEKASQPISSLLSDEVDFPRGGGTSFTPLEVKTIRAEAVKEANDQLFQASAVMSSPYYSLTFYAGFTREANEAEST